MSKQVWIRPMKDEEKPLLAKWLYESRDRNRFDPEIFKKSQVKVYVAYDETGPVMFIPVAIAYLIESLAPKPGLSPITEAKAFQAMQHVFACKANEQNIGEMFFVTFDDSVLEFAQNYGWDKVVVPILNLHLSNLEKPSEKSHEA